MTDIDFEKVKSEIKSLYYGTVKISNLFKTPISKPIEFKKYALINKKWLNFYKIACNYNGFSSILQRYKNNQEQEILNGIRNNLIKINYEQRKQLLNILEFIKPAIFFSEFAL